MPFDATQCADVKLVRAASVANKANCFILSLILRSSLQIGRVLAGPRNVSRCLTLECRMFNICTMANVFSDFQNPSE